MESGFAKRLLRGGRMSGAISLMYHAVESGYDVPRWRWAVSLAQFEKHLDLIAATGWQTRCIRDLNNCAQGVPRKTVFITFDDGYADNYPAFQALLARHMKATWFIVADTIDEESGWANNDGERRPMLSQPQLREMATAGMEIGSHTWSHVRLTGLTDNALSDELVGSKRQLENILGEEVTSLAYPYGEYNAKVIEAALATGYTAACSCRSGAIQRGENLMEIRRLTVFNTDTRDRLARKLTFAENDGRLRTAVRYYARRVIGRLRVLGP